MYIHTYKVPYISIYIYIMYYVHIHNHMTLLYCINESYRLIWRGSRYSTIETWMVGRHVWTLSNGWVSKKERKPEDPCKLCGFLMFSCLKASREHLVLWWRRHPNELIAIFWRTLLNLSGENAAAKMQGSKLGTPEKRNGPHKNDQGLGLNFQNFPKPYSVLQAHSHGIPRGKQIHCSTSAPCCMIHSSDTCELKKHSFSVAEVAEVWT